MARMGNASTTPEETLLSQHGGLQESMFGVDAPLYWTLVPGAIAAVYGLVHVAAWDTAFPNAVERTLWRVTSLAMVACGILPSIVLEFLNDLLTQPESMHAIFRVYCWYMSKEKGVTFLRYISYVDLYASLALYPVLTACLLVESVKQVFYLPAGAFELPDSSVYVPHLS
ncbi:uncharacterized protein PHACADRAFT_184886 [Phanerochaete carnosa HHB-10118-sp]|uniref:Uncharacterized protein n=1 Tax=Phanerochaete carnosa (strain HHB-10118-sp) TaxID=650164 RepID=K5X0C7_PHACS|nr:uncharacterized protein PHACADRAFT_184886 [Phanerochaete carnosa HHB-10118-sp]EKM56217.1 hypothetical protein PHACADRAFT_184886 [Phanerochaete carnosa HHB-10118-sp]